MRADCRHYESRTYSSGEVVRKCRLDLAPDAPWRCPEPCSGFERRMDMGWTYGSAVAPRTPDEPPGLDDGSAAAVLDEAEDFINSIGADVIADVEARRIEEQNRRGLKRLFRRRKDR